MSSDLLGLIRIEIPDDQIKFQGKAQTFFDILPNSHDLTEEYFYAHIPITDNTIPVYSTSEIIIGKLDNSPETREQFKILSGPVMIVARKGYAGRLFVADCPELIVHEDAYAVKPKEEYLDKIDFGWFSEHYSTEFQANRTSMWGIGDFPRERFNNMNVVIPSRPFQKRCKLLYMKRKNLIKNLSNFPDLVYSSIDSLIDEKLTSR